MIAEGADTAAISVEITTIQTQTSVKGILCSKKWEVYKLKSHYL